MEIVAVTKGRTEKKVMLRNVSPTDTENMVRDKAMMASGEALHSLFGYHVSINRDTMTALVRLDTD